MARVGGDGGGWRRRCSGFVFFRVVEGDLRGVPIWSGRSAVFGFVRICSGLFRFVRGVLERSAGMAEGLTAARFWQPLSTFGNLASTSVKFWQALARLGSCLRRNDGRGARRRCCGERGMVRHSCSVASIAGVGGSEGVGGGSCLRRNDGEGRGVTEGGRNDGGKTQWRRRVWRGWIRARQIGDRRGVGRRRRRCPGLFLRGRLWGCPARRALVESPAWRGGLGGGRLPPATG